MRSSSADDRAGRNFPGDALGHVSGLRRLTESEAHWELGTYRSRCLQRTVVPMQVTHLVPRHYAAYCRILPPLQVSVRGGRWERWQWTTALQFVGRAGLPGQLVRDFALAQASMEVAGVRASPLVGLACREVMLDLVDALGISTQRDHPCVYYFWSGRGALGQNQGHLVYRGPMIAVAELFMHPGRPLQSYQSPTAFWPDGTAWTFAMHTDSPAAYLGGPSAVVDDIVGAASLEATHVTAATEVDDWTDRSAW